MMNRHVFGLGMALLALTVWAAVAQAGIIPVPNGDFEDWLAPTLGNNTSNWSSENTTTDNNGPGDTGVADGNNDMWDALRTSDEFWSNDSSFGSGWQSNGPADTDDGNPFDDGKFGLQHPNEPSYFSGSGSPNYTLDLPFNGRFIGFVNMDDADGFDQEVQSKTIGNLTPGMKYVLNVAVGARPRPNGDWNDIKYDIMLVANPTDGDGTGRNFGSSGGTILGTPSTVTMVPFTAVADGSNIVDLQYMFTATTSDPYAIRIAAHNLLTLDGVADPGDGNNNDQPPGTDYQFTQANFDNVRLRSVPEPSSLVLLGLAAMGMFCFRRRGA